MASNQHTLPECRLSAISRLENEDDLIGALQHEIDVVLTKAWIEEIVEEEQLSSLSCRVKAEKFVVMIKERVPSDPRMFDAFVAILRSFPSLRHLADRLAEYLCSEHRPTINRHGGVPGSPPRTSTPKTKTPGSKRNRHRRASSENVKFNKRSPPKTRKRRSSSTSDGMPKLSTRDDTDEESGFQDESSVQAVNPDSRIDESEAADSETFDNHDEVTHHHDQADQFVQPVQAQSDYKPFSKTTGYSSEADGNSPKPSSVQDNPPGDSELVPGRHEIQHNPATRKQIIRGSGVQETAEGCVEKATYLNEGSPKTREKNEEIEELKAKIASLKELILANRKENETMEQMKECIREREVEVGEYKRTLAEKERELNSLQEERDAQMQAAEEKLEKERAEHKAKIDKIEEEVKSLESQLEEKSKEAAKLQQEYDDLKKATTLKIQKLEEELKEKTMEAEKLKVEYQQREVERKQEMKQLNEKYQKKIGELEELVQSRKEQAALKESNLEMKYQLAYERKENQRLKDETELKLQIKELEKKLAEKETEVQQMQNEEVKEKMSKQAKEFAEQREKYEQTMKLERIESQQRIQELEIQVQRLSSLSSTSSSEVSVSRSNTGPSTTAATNANKNDTETDITKFTLSDSEKED